MRRLLGSVAAAALLLPAPAGAWGRYGHATVAEIAWARAAPETRAAMRALLRQSHLLDTPECPAATLSQASIWADCIRRYRERFSYTASWHYQNVSVCRPFDLGEACRDGNCAQAQVTRNATLLADRDLPARERLTALLFLVHFVGDLHQPLHAGDDGDRGGNDVPARYGIVERERMNLHSLWDGYLAERAITTPGADAAGLLAEGGDRLDALATGTPEEWSREAWAASRDAAYAPVRGGDPCARGGKAGVDEPQVAVAIPAIRDGVLKAGVRLARLLDEALATR